MKKKTIAVSTRFLIKGKLEGVGRFTCETLRHITQNHPEHDFIFLFDRPYSEDFLFAPNVTPMVLPPPTRHPFIWYPWFEWSVPRALKKVKADVFLSPDGFASLRTDVPQVVVVHDLAFQHYPEQVPFLVRKYFRHFTPKYCQKAQRIIAVSEFTKQDIVQQYGISPDKIEVVYNAADSTFYRPLGLLERQYIQLQYALGHPYFLFVGAIHPRKNLANILRAYDAFKQEHPDLRMKFLVAGRKAWQSSEAFSVYKNMVFKEEVIFLGHLQMEVLAKVLGAAEALVYASLFEGFGIPILEAFHTKTPVITSNVASMPEVAGDAALLVDPTNVKQIQEALKKIVYNEDGLIHHLSTAGTARTKHFDWGKSGGKLGEQLMKVV